MDESNRMNSLKTIYSRITTMAGAEEVLNGIGISINDMATGEVRQVTEILGDLSKQWTKISDSERQNIAVKIAGRHQLSRFLALMNNYDMALESTATALTSEGSAMRENAEYLKSFEARINKLKTAFTEFSLAMGDAVLSGGMLAVIEGLTALAKVGIEVVKTFGALPLLFITIAGVMGKMGVLSKFHNTLEGKLSSIAGFFKKTEDSAKKSGKAIGVAVGSTVPHLEKQEKATKGVEKASNGATVATKSFSTSLKGMLATTGIGIAFILLGTAIEFLVGKFQDAKLKQEEMIRLNEKMITSYRASGDGMQGMLSRYSELISKQNRQKEEQIELNSITKQFAELLPTTVDYIDAKGEAHLKNVNIIRDEIDSVKELSRAEAELKVAQYDSSLREQADEYAKVTKKIEKNRKKRKDLLKEDNTLLKPVNHDSGYHVVKQMIDNEEELAENKIENILLEDERTKMIQEQVRAVQSQSLAYFEANGKLMTLGDSQQKFMENLLASNEGLLRNATNDGEFVTAMDDLYQMSVSVGEVFSDSFTLMTKGLEDKPQMINEIKTSLDLVSKAVPDSFFKFEGDNTQESINKMTNSLKEMINVSQHIKAGSQDFDGLRQRIENTGVASDVAGDYISKLSLEYDNIPLRMQAVKEGFDGITESAENHNEAVLDSVDVLGEFFGYTTSDLSAMESHIQYMDLLVQKHSDGAYSMDEYKDSLSSLAEKLNITDEELSENAHSYYNIIQAMKKVKIATDEHGRSYLDLSKAYSELTQEEAEMFDKWINSDTDIITGKLKEITKSADETKEAYNELKTSANETFKPLVSPFQKGVMADLHKANEVIDNATDLFGNANVVSKAVETVAKSSATLTEIKEDVLDVGESAKETGKKTVSAGDSMIDIFKKLSSAVETRISNMIKNYNRQGNAIDEVGRKARDAKRDIENMNSTSKSSSTRSFTRPSSGRVGILSYNGNSESIATAMSGYSDSINSAFSVSSGEGGSGFASGGEGSSGVMQPSIYGGLNHYGEYEINSLHGSDGKNPFAYNPNDWGSSSKKSSKKKSNKEKVATAKANAEAKKIEALAELYVVDVINRVRVSYETNAKQIEAKMDGLTKGTKAYRDSLKSVYAYEVKIHALNQKELTQTIARNKAIEKRIKQLANVNKHNKAQREEYNKLQQDYDSNLSKIASLSAEVVKASIDIKKNVESIFGDFLEEILSNFHKAVNAIEGRIDNIDFNLEVLEITNPDDTSAKIDLLSEKTDEYMRLRISYMESKEELEAQLKIASKKYGSESDVVQQILKELETLDEAIEDTTINIIRTQKEIANARGDIADDIIDTLKDHYKNAEKMAIESSEKQTEAIEKAHKEQMDIYDEKIDKINEVYNASIKELDDEANKENFDAELAEKNSNIADLTNKRALLKGDTSLEGKKRLAELDEELRKAQEELDKFLRDHQRDELKKQLELDRDAQIQSIEDTKEHEEEKVKITLEALEKEREAISAHYERILNDEQRWATIRGEIIKGNFSVIEGELISMGITLDQLTDGTFDNLSSNFAKYSEEVRNFVNEINNMVNEINKNIQPNTGSSGGHGGVGGGIASHQIPYIINKAKNGIELDEPTADKTHLYNLIRNSSIPEAQMAEIYKKAKNGTPLAEPTPEKMMFYDLFLELIKKNIPSFDTGGYTGTWSGNGGKLAMLHKEELVLNERQTRDILNTAKLMDKIRSIMPIINPTNISAMKNSGISANSGATTEYNLTVHIDKLNGDKEGANTVVKEVIKGLKKMGR